MNDADSACVRDAIVHCASSMEAHIRDFLEGVPVYAPAYRLVPYRDGNQWCVLLGDDLQSGIAGFGNSPSAAIADFERAMRTKEGRSNG